VTVESTINSIFVKLPENCVCASSVLEEVSARVGVPAEHLILLDAKFVPVSNDERDMEYWRVPSRRFYIASRAEFQDLRKSKGKALKLSRKRRRDQEEEDDEEESFSLGRVAQDLETVVKEVVELKCDLTAIKSLQGSFDDARREARLELIRDQLRLLECKICRDTPTPPIVVVTCCKQVLGCETCYQNCLDQNDCCPLCRDPGMQGIVVEGLNPLYTFLKDNQ
jgi:hypothetical protein